MAPASVRRPPYKDFLQPALHRRFSTTALILLAIAYVYAIGLARWNSFLWSWFPIGPTGIRAAFLWFSGSLILILRIAQYHPGYRTSDSAYDTFLKHYRNFSTLETIVTYVFSAWLFAQVYLFSRPKDSGLEWVTYLSYDRQRLNEKAVAFTTHFAILGAYMAIRHLWLDTDRLLLGVAKPSEAAVQNNSSDVGTLMKKFWGEMPTIFSQSLHETVASAILTFVIYPLFLRKAVWRLSLFFFRPFFNLPKTNYVPYSWPVSFSSLISMVLASIMLLIVWIAGNTAFTMFMVKEPTKDQRPFTSGSKDPNGSLLNGLKHKKLFYRCFAMWELALIARDFPERRKAIYEDIDRKDGPAWSQVCSICLDVLKSLETNIGNYGKAPEPVSAPVAQPVEEKVRTAPPLKEDPIYLGGPARRRNFRSEVEKVVTQVAVAPGQESHLSPFAKRIVDAAKHQLLEVQKAATGTDDTASLVRSYALKGLRKWVGIPFRQEYRRRITHAVLGGPYGEPSLYINAAYALSMLTSHSLQEDKYGNVQRDIATIIRTLTNVTKRLERFKEGFEVHWTDVEAVKECPEVDAILEALREALSTLIVEFGPYARDLRLTLTDMRLAREAANFPEPQPRMDDLLDLSQWKR
ncbi:nucleoporin protein Ndc1-Nup [Neurospora tetraspora]|uniref:Nucleoporin protein Ndc1-Nup n=1 Tax=Neurospora tetraspora TaxID=94610 RepID=A0AAE0JET1_9PEZI|nr:nucleoporin protein Ndc1-Nup [Neurospora tetraspora]